MAIEKLWLLLNSNGRFILSIEKNSCEFLDYGKHKVKVFPDDLRKTIILLKNSGFNIENVIETEFANIISSTKNGGVIMNFEQCRIVPLNDEYISEMSTWQYDAPYEAYSFRVEGYLMNKDIWGIEQFCMIYENIVLGQVACQFDNNNNNMWVGWSLNPAYCGKGMGKEFISRCVDELCRIKNYKKGNIYLRVASWNKRAIKCYEKAGFKYYKTILDEIAGTGKQEDFYVMQIAASTN